MTRPDFVEMAREWLVRATGHARRNEEESLARELERVWELGIANAIEIVAAAKERDPVHGYIDQDDTIDALRDLMIVTKSTGAHTCLKTHDGTCLICGVRL